MAESLLAEPSDDSIFSKRVFASLGESKTRYEPIGYPFLISQAANVKNRCIKTVPKKSHDENSIQYPAQCDYAKGKKK
jgi:hypothetical protein